MVLDSATIRHATRQDVDTIYSLVVELAVYERAGSLVTATSESFTPGYARTFLLIAPNSDIAGIALYLYNYSTRVSVPSVYLKQLIIKEKHRKRGYSKALIKVYAKEEFIIKR
ncbi:hypothetical protein P171DRAFT_346489 [Karstenula rhodostoma CBS 690.94]|uniref:N-acetyltransferase domain-containing protein n=1 Tax=Karstenula rhodostoma CBS 690.94 TaxID=1392251 RepID=A0A9P4PYH6_9PLEO|nr:hypothetical protein P171DRAFT_346489 [Karstenula rhodostoma CBS 690.94]